MQPFHFIHHLLELIKLRGNSGGITAKLLPGISQKDLLAQLFKQGQPDGLFQLLDLHGNRRLRQV